MCGLVVQKRRPGRENSARYELERAVGSVLQPDAELQKGGHSSRRPALVDNAAVTCSSRFGA